MSEYAEDIRSAAINLADTLILEREVSGQSQEYTKWAYMMCAQALMARDNRAANIVEDAAPVFQDMEFAPLQELSARIANAILTQSEN